MIDDRMCDYLEWDSRFFGVRIARAASETLTRTSAERMLAWCDERSIDCLYFLAASGDRSTVKLLEEYRFEFVDIRLTLGAVGVGTDGDKHTGDALIRPARPEDIPSLRAIARVSHRDSRFYCDSHFPSALCDALYETWVEKSCNGYADTVLLGEFHGRPAGYISCHLKGDHLGQIGLVAVDEAARGNGLGRKLVLASLGWFDQRGVRRISVVTQGRNCAAQRLYQRCGFLTESVHLWYHIWFKRSVKSLK